MNTRTRSSDFKRDTNKSWNHEIVGVGGDP